jgi:hypothetical protein
MHELDVPSCSRNEKEVELVSCETLSEAVRISLVAPSGLVESFRVCIDQVLEGSIQDMELPKERVPGVLVLLLNRH